MQLSRLCVDQTVPFYNTQICTLNLIIGKHMPMIGSEFHQRQLWEEVKRDALEMSMGEGNKGLSQPGTGGRVADPLTVTGGANLVKKDVPRKHLMHHRESSLCFTHWPIERVTRHGPQQEKCMVWQHLDFCNWTKGLALLQDWVTSNQRWPGSEPWWIHSNRMSGQCWQEQDDWQLDRKW